MTPTDTNAHKRQRTDKAHDSSVVVNVGGTLFSTFRSTLTMKSTYFEKRLSGRFSDDAGDSEIIVDRDHEPFSIILSYLRSGKLSVPSDQLTLRLVLIEVDFYGIDELVDMVRDKCYCNLYHVDTDDYDDAYLSDCKSIFPSYEQIIEHRFFPSMYFDKVNYYRVISTQMLPDNKYARLRKYDNTFEFVAVCQSITYECIQTHTVLVEPLLCLAEAAPSWMSQKSPTDWREKGKETFARQLVPVSFWLGFKRHLYHQTWYTATKTEYKPDKNRCEYTVKIDGKPVTLRADLTMFYSVDTHSKLNHTELYGYSASGVLMKVSDFRGFMHMGPATDADIAVTTDTSSDEEDYDGLDDLFTDDDEEDDEDTGDDDD